MRTQKEEFEIREMRHEDMPQLLALWASLIDRHREIDEPLYTPKEKASLTYERWLIRRVKEDGGRVWVAQADARIVGYVLAIVGHRSPVYQARTVGMICDLSVASDMGRKGIGSALVSHVLLAFLNQGLDTIQVNYDHQNEAACRFWQKMGFRPRLVEAYRQVGAALTTGQAAITKEGGF